MSVSVVDSPLTGWGVPTDQEALLPQNISSNILEASRFVKSGPGKLYGFTVYNSKTSAQFILIFDRASLPADGAVPACVFTVAASSNLPIQWIPWRTFGTGCVMCNSSTANTKTIGSPDCWFDVQFV